jgi:prolyl oligopeptidase
MRLLSVIARPAGVLLCLAGLAGTLTAAPAALPLAPVRDVTQVLHGVTVHDPYRYLENVKDPEVQAWLRAQGQDTRQTLDRIELRDELLRTIQSRSEAGGDNINRVVRMPQDRIYYLKRPRGQKQSKLMMRIGLRGADKVLVDPEIDSRRTGVPHAINYFVPSWDGKHVAYGMSAGGSEDASLYVIDVQTLKTVGSAIPRVQEALVSWLPDSKSFTYNQLQERKSGAAETETFLDSRVMWQKLGEPASLAQPVFGPTVTRNLGLAALDVGGLVFSPDSDWMVARTTDTTLPEGFLFIARVSDLGKPAITWKKIAGYSDKITHIELRDRRASCRERV